MTTDSAKKACVFCSGQFSNSAKVKKIATNCDLLVAAGNAGAQYFFDMELIPKSSLVTRIPATPI